MPRSGWSQNDAMRRTHVTEHDLKEAMRIQGKEPDLSRINSAHLERNGEISIITQKES